MVGRHNPNPGKISVQGDQTARSSNSWMAKNNLTPFQTSCHCSNPLLSGLNEPFLHCDVSSKYEAMDACHYGDETEFAVVAYQEQHGAAYFSDAQLDVLHPTDPPCVLQHLHHMARNW